MCDPAPCLQPIDAPSRQAFLEASQSLYVMQASLQCLSLGTHKPAAMIVRICMCIGVCEVSYTALPLQTHCCLSEIGHSIFNPLIGFWHVAEDCERAVLEEITMTRLGRQKARGSSQAVHPPGRAGSRIYKASTARYVFLQSVLTWPFFSQQTAVSARLSHAIETRQRHRGRSVFARPSPGARTGELVSNDMGSIG